MKDILTASNVPSDFKHGDILNKDIAMLKKQRAPGLTCNLIGSIAKGIAKEP